MKCHFCSKSASPGLKVAIEGVFPVPACKEHYDKWKNGTDDSMYEAIVKKHVIGRTHA